MTPYGAEELQLHPFLTSAAVIIFAPRPLFPRGKVLMYPFNTGRMGPRAGADVSVKRKIAFFCRKPNHYSHVTFRIFSKHVVSHEALIDDDPQFL